MTREQEDAWATYLNTVAPFKVDYQKACIALLEASDTAFKIYLEEREENAA